LYLKRLEIQGFKSFADKVELEFNPGITVVVGPNGSGKSNVVDAIRWVLGEQSAKTLRGLRMDDIIFSGSTSRRPLGMAQVSLTLDNTSGIFPLDYNEVTVTRRLYRSGESEYLINKVPCRMKDIHQLFMDTGMGREGFSVIGQGKIDEILSLKAEERRSLIEEAAGIVKYRYRKKEAERKLEDTEQSLVRINDIVGELEEQLGPLGEQAEKAKEYQNWKKELDQWEISLAIQAIEENEVKEKEVKKALAGLEDSLTEANTKYHRLSSQLEQERFRQQELDQSIANLQQKLYDLNSEIERKEHQTEMAKERKMGILAQLERVTLELANYDKQEKSLASDITEKNKQLTKLKLDYEEALHIVQELADALQQQKFLFHNQSLKLEEYKSQVIETLQEKAGINNEILRLENEMGLLTRRSELLREKILKIEMDLDNLAAQQSALEEHKKNYLKIKTSGEDQLNHLQKSLRDNSLALEKIKKDIEQRQLNYQQIFSRLQVLEEMEETGEGYQQGVKSVLELRPNLPGILGTVADIIFVPSKLETALETALGGAIQYIITENDQAAQKAINYLKTEKKGRATFLPLNTIKFTKGNLKLEFPGVIGRAADLIGFAKKYEAIVEHLLGKVWVIENLETLVAIGKKTNFSYRMVTLDGEIITPGGALTGGSYRKQKTGLLTRKRLIKELSEELLKKSREIELEKKKLTAEEQKFLQLNKEIESQKNLLQENQLALTEVENKWAYLSQEIKRINQEKAAFNLEQEEIATQKRMNNQEKDKLLQNRQLKEAEILTREKEISILQESIKGSAATQDGLVEDLNAKKIKTATLKQALEHSEEQLASLEEALLNFEQGKNKLLSEKEDLERKNKKLAEEIKLTQAEVNTLMGQLALLEERINNEKVKRVDLQELIISLEKEIKGKQAEIEHLKNDVYQHNMRLAKIEMEITASREKLKEQFGYEYEEALNYKVDIQNRRNVIKRINELKTCIADLGLVNFAAITEYERVSQRLDFLAKQLKDLNEARESLMKVIKDMDQIMVRKFKDAFNRVNEAFNAVFTDMFGGGTAALELSDAGNLLDTGIEIMAQPPGKKPQTLSLLSGGERAMTAIALLFAILKVKPSPFCVLDEIEAALDEANVDRFSAFLKQYVDKTQFIIISHRKGTMEVADVLYGVTIEQDTGVSKLISVKLSEAV